MITWEIWGSCQLPLRRCRPTSASHRQWGVFGCIRLNPPSPPSGGITDRLPALKVNRQQDQPPARAEKDPRKGRHTCMHVPLGSWDCQLLSILGAVPVLPMSPSCLCCCSCIRQYHRFLCFTCYLMLLLLSDDVHSVGQTLPLCVWPTPVGSGICTLWSWKDDTALASLQ